MRRRADMSDPTQPIVDFLERVAGAFGINATIAREDTADGPRLNFEGEQSELLARHRGEPLKALQHIVDSAFGRDARDERRVFIDALGYRKGKDLELRQMAKLLAEDRKSTRLNSSHVEISYAVFCLKKKKKILSSAGIKQTEKQTQLK